MSKIDLFPLFQARTIGLVLLGIWAGSVTAVLPTSILTSVQDIRFGSTNLVISQVCAESWPFPFLHLGYSVFIMVIQYIIPITVILVTHVMIIKTVQQRTCTTSSIHGSSRSEVTMKRNRKTTKILLIIAAAFGLHWLPYHLYTIGKASNMNREH